MKYDTKTIFLNNEAPIAGDKFTENRFTIKGEQKIIFDLSNIAKVTTDTSNNVASASVNGAVTLNTQTMKLSGDQNGGTHIGVLSSTGVTPEPINIGDIITSTGLPAGVTVLSASDHVPALSSLIINKPVTLADNADLTFTNNPTVTLDNNEGIIIPDMVVEGTGISGFVTVKEVTNQNNIKLSVPIALSNDVALTFTLKVLSTIYKTKADWGDGREDYYESVFNHDTLQFEPPKTIEHTYSITTSADVLKGVVFFEYQNGLTSFSQLCAYCSRANLIDLQMKNLENQLFVVEDVKKLTTYVDKNNNLYNLALTPNLLTRYDTSQQDIIEIPEDDRLFLQSSELGDQENVKSATDIQAKNSPAKSAYDYSGTRFLVY